MSISDFLLLISGVLSMSNIDAMIQCELEAIHDRVVRTTFPTSYSTLLHLEHGLLTGEEEFVSVNGPAVCYWPQNLRPSLILKAGSRAKLLGLNEKILNNAVTAGTDSLQLKILIENPFLASISEKRYETQIETLMNWFELELSENAVQSETILSSILRLILINSISTQILEHKGKSSDNSSVFRNYLHLVAVHYREHWSIAKYSEELGIDYDRLHKICKNKAKCSPIRLVHERLISEAKTRLENTGFPLKVIAADLGFKDVSGFCHFFKQKTKQTPGEFRSTAVDRNSVNFEMGRSFSDWP